MVGFGQGGVRLGNDKIVVASNLNIIKDILLREEFDSRPDGFFFRLRSFGERYGLVFTEGKFFNEQKKFCLKHLKSLGLNRSIMEDRINYETSELVQHILKNPQKAVKLPEALEVSVLNSLWTMMAGERFALNDPKARRLFQHIHDSFRMQDMTGGVINQMPFLRFLVPGVHRSFTKLTFILHNLTSFIQELIQNHWESISPYENRDLIDSFINEMTKRADEKTTFTEKQLIMLILDLFLAGAETTTSTLGFSILYLIHYPEVQEKLQKEMDAVVGRNNQPFLQHKSRLIFFEAFINEVQRISNVSPTTVSHRAREDAVVNGYTIPKDTIVIANLYSLHMDKDHWGDPEDFRPDRFIDKDGQLIQDEWLMPFGIGKRKCIGETLARTSLFLFLSSMLHNFVISPHPEKPLPPIRALDGATLVPDSYEAVFTPRN